LLFGEVDEEFYLYLLSVKKHYKKIINMKLISMTKNS